MTVQHIDERLIRISDVLGQIEKLNKMIVLHREQTKDRSMQEQYESMRSKFLKELKTLLENFEIRVSDLAAA